MRTVYRSIVACKYRPIMRTIILERKLKTKTWEYYYCLRYRMFRLLVGKDCKLHIALFMLGYQILCSIYTFLKNSSGDIWTQFWQFFCTWVIANLGVALYGRRFNNFKYFVINSSLLLYFHLFSDWKKKKWIHLKVRHLILRKINTVLFFRLLRTYSESRRL